MMIMDRRFEEHLNLPYISKKFTREFVSKHLSILLHGGYFDARTGIVNEGKLEDLTSFVKRVHDDVLRRKAHWENGRIDEAFEGLDSTLRVRDLIDYKAFPEEAMSTFLGTAYERSAKDTLAAYGGWYRLKLAGASKKEIQEARDEYKRRRNEEKKRWRKLPEDKRRIMFRTELGPDWRVLEVAYHKRKHGIGPGFWDALGERRRIRQELRKPKRK
jgi:hypothetical protein